MSKNSNLKILLESKVGVRFKGNTSDLVDFISGVSEKFAEQKLHELEKQEIEDFLEDKEWLFPDVREFEPVEGIKIQYLDKNEDFGPHILMILDDFFCHEPTELERFKKAVDETKKNF